MIEHYSEVVFFINDRANYWKCASEQNGCMVNFIINQFIGLSPVSRWQYKKMAKQNI